MKVVPTTLLHSSHKTAVRVKSSQRRKMRSKTDLRNEMNNVEREIIVNLNCTTEHFMIITIPSTKRKNPRNR